MDGQTSARPGRLALAVHGLHRIAPLGQTVPVAVQVEARDGHLHIKTQDKEGRPKATEHKEAEHVAQTKQKRQHTLRDIMEWTAARPSRSISTNLAFGKMRAR